MTRPGKIPSQAGLEPRIFHSDALTTRPTRRSFQKKQDSSLSLADVWQVMLCTIHNVLCFFLHAGFSSPGTDRLLGLVGKASTSRVEDPGFDSRLRRDFSGSSHTSDFKIGTPVATLPGAWRYRVSAGTGRPGVSIL